MVLRSRTGLLESVKKPLKKQRQDSPIEFLNLTKPAPFVLRPFAGIYNPFPYGCSILCNHPADHEAKDVVKRAKDSWAADGKAILLPDELAAIRANLLHNMAPYDDGEDAVPEELFRRYTDTDSRPLTPAPTLASGGTRGSGRRCVTPDPTPFPTRERTLLVVDLRRSHSQDTLSCLGMAVSSSTRASSPSAQGSAAPRKRVLPKKKVVSHTARPKPEPVSSSPDKITSVQKDLLEVPSVTKEGSSPVTPNQTDTGGSEDEDAPRRRGKRVKRKKSDRADSKEPDKGFQGIPDPGETQMSTLGDDLHNQSTRPSTSGPIGDETSPRDIVVDTSAGIMCLQKLELNGKSFIDPATLRRLQRELDQEVIDAEFGPRRKRALEEAMKCRPTEKRPAGKEMRQLKKELHVPKQNTETWLTLPRTFTRQSARFELPLDSRTLNKMTPLEYAQGFVAISSGRVMLYNQVFNRHREELEDEDTDRRISAANVVEALGEVMGQPLSVSQAQYFRDLMGLEDSALLDFRTWSGVCALSERLLAPQFMPSPSRTQDPCHEVEQADFETLPRKLRSLEPDQRLKTILLGIREL